MQSRELRTLAFYDKNATCYALQTERANLRPLYDRFLSLLPSGGRILDIGCGGGRDLRAFKASGFECIGVDPSARLAQIASEYSACEVIVARAQDLCFEEEFDGAWACASLLHICRSDLPLTLSRIYKALRPGGVLFLSMQAGCGNSDAADGRFYERYSIAELASVVLSASLEIIDQWTTPDALPGRKSISWINLLARRPDMRDSKG